MIKNMIITTLVICLVFITYKYVITSKRLTKLENVIIEKLGQAQTNLNNAKKENKQKREELEKLKEKIKKVKEAKLLRKQND